MRNLFSKIGRLLPPWGRSGRAVSFPDMFSRFQSILATNNEVLELMADMGDKLGGDYVFDRQYLISSCERLFGLVQQLIYDLDVLSGQKYLDLYGVFEKIKGQIEAELVGKVRTGDLPYTVGYDELSRDWCDIVGSKNANLGEVRNVLEVSTPAGFAITTRGYFEIMATPPLPNLVEKLLAADSSTDEAQLLGQLAAIRQEILRAPIPDGLVREINARLETIGWGLSQGHLNLVLRSSAWEEDGEHSFAGLYLSLLNVPEAEILNGYRQVLAAAYNPEAWRYRQDRGLQQHEAAMAVACQLLVDAKVSGVLYTLDPAAPEANVLAVSATWGLGLPVVQGSQRVDQFRLHRDPPHELRRLHVVRKEQMLAPDPTGGTRWTEVPKHQQERPCLTTDQLQELAHTGLVLERYFKRPQDVEWAFDRTGTLIILQTRPLKVSALAAGPSCRIDEVTAQAPVIWAGKGEVVQRGIAVGEVFVVDKDEDLTRVPLGAILVAPESSPRLARVIHKIRGIITDVGSPMGHMATVAREFRLPMVVNTGIATRALRSGEAITLDATENVVYKGKISELCYYELTQEEVFEESYEYRLLRRLLRRITPLNLLDPNDANFDPAGCRTLHDITRFVHEKAVAELMHLTASSAASTPRARPLKMPIPLDLQVIDVDGGTAAAAEAGGVELAEIESIPMQAFIDGLLNSNLWSTAPVSVDLSSFMASMSRTFSTSLASPEQIGRNLVVLSRKYMNLSLRLGYHFNIIDAYVGEEMNENYAYFRFLGGVSDMSRRSRRARLIGEILERMGFRVEIRGDLVVARIKKRPLEMMREKMRVLGALVAYTRQLDVQLGSDIDVADHLERFLQAMDVSLEHPPTPGGGEHGSRQQDEDSHSGR